MASKWYPVNKDKLYQAFKKRNLTASEFSIELGYSKWFIAKSADRGTFTQAVVMMLDKIYNIKPEDYAPDPEPVEEWDPLAEIKPVPVQEARELIDYEKLSAVICEAIYQALKKVREEAASDD